MSERATERERMTDEELAQQVQYIEEDEQNMMGWQDRRILREAARRLRASADAPTEEREWLTDEELESFYAYAERNMRGPTGDRRRWADYTVRLIEEVRRLREIEEAARDVIRNAGASICDCGDEHHGYWMPVTAFRRFVNALDTDSRRGGE